MTPSAQLYVVDADVFITAKNRYYAFDICPGFWKSVIGRHHHGRVYSIDRVKGELLAGRQTDDLVRWVKEDVPASFFRGVDDEAVASKYAEIMLWVQRDTRRGDSARRSSPRAPMVGWLRLPRSMMPPW